jgi:hypothetical protein
MYFLEADGRLQYSDRRTGQGGHIVGSILCCWFSLALGRARRQMQACEMEPDGLESRFPGTRTWGQRARTFPPFIIIIYNIYIFVLISRIQI